MFSLLQKNVEINNICNAAFDGCGISTTKKENHKNIYKASAKCDTKRVTKWKCTFVFCYVDLKWHQSCSAAGNANDIVSLS